MSVSADISALIAALLTGQNDLGVVSFKTSDQQLIRLQPGTGSYQADKLFSDQRTLAASATENIDLAGALTDPFGAALTFAKVKAIYIRAAAGNTNDVVVGGVGSNAFIGPFGANTHTVAVKPGGVLLMVAPDSGWTVTAATGDLLKILNGGGSTSVTYDIIIIGTSA